MARSPRCSCPRQPGVPGRFLTPYSRDFFAVVVGAGERGKRSRVHGELVCGPETLSEAELAKNRSDFGNDIRAHPLDDAYHRARSPMWSKVKVPFLSTANWGGQALHPRGNFEGFVRAAPKRQMARSARHRALDALLHRLRPQAATALLRLFPARQEERLGQAAARATAGAPRRPLRRARRERMAARAHQVDASSISIPSTARCAKRRGARKAVMRFDAMGDGVTFLSRAASRRRPRSPARRR